MECLLCDIWARMPYAKRPTTPTSAQETEGAVVVGYWIASRYESVPRMCERHMTILTALDEQENCRIANEQKLQEQAAAEAARQHIYPVTSIIQTQQQTNELSGFQLGPGPLPNENTASSQLPIGSTDLAAPYRKEDERPLEPRHRAKPIPAIAVPILNEPVTETIEVTENAGKITHPCPLCGKRVASGEVHSC
jgi:hypothetical protein